MMHTLLLFQLQNEEADDQGTLDEYVRQKNYSLDEYERLNLFS